jgi:hypothetical protein
MYLLQKQKKPLQAKTIMEQMFQEFVVVKENNMQVMVGNMLSLNILLQKELSIKTVPFYFKEDYKK